MTKELRSQEPYRNLVGYEGSETISKKDDSPVKIRLESFSQEICDSVHPCEGSLRYRILPTQKLNRIDLNLTTKPGSQP